MSFITNKRLKHFIAYLLSIFFIFGIWIGVSYKINSEIILPLPKLVFSAFFNNLKSAIFWKSFGFTFLRIIISSFCAVFIGTIIGFLSAEFSFVDDFFAIPILIIRSTPVIALILVVMFWFDSTIVPVFIAFLMTMPLMISSAKTGIQNAPKDKIFFLKSHGFSRFRVFLLVKLPASKQNLMEGFIQVFALAWKVVVAGEVLSLPRFAMGSLLQKSQVHIQTDSVMAITLFMIIISLIIETTLKLIFYRSKSKELKINNN